MLDGGGFGIKEFDYSCGELFSVVRIKPGARYEMGVPFGTRPILRADLWFLGNLADTVNAHSGKYITKVLWVYMNDAKPFWIADSVTEDKLP